MGQAPLPLPLSLPTALSLGWEKKCCGKLRNCFAIYWWKGLPHMDSLGFLFGYATSCVAASVNANANVDVDADANVLSCLLWKRKFIRFSVLDCRIWDSCVPEDGKKDRERERERGRVVKGESWVKRPVQVTLLPKNILAQNCYYLFYFVQ